MVKTCGSAEPHPIAVHLRMHTGKDCRHGATAEKKVLSTLGVRIRRECAAHEVRVLSDATMNESVAAVPYGILD